MFNKELFRYDEETHTGYYNDKVVPSVTQLVDILYPYDSDIPQERLENAAKRGTTIHGIIEVANTYFDNPLDFETNLHEVMNDALRMGTKELIDYVQILSAYKLRPFDYENIVFLVDENGDLICYGHYDCVVMATKDITIGETNLFIEGRLYLIDYKTTSLFDRRKVALQESIYATAYQQSSGNQISGIYGLWLREGAKIIPLNQKKDDYVINLCKALRSEYEQL